jgi:hypothetical protein
MADFDAEQENLFKEVDEDLRQERFAKLWKRFGKYIIGAAVAVVVAVGGFQLWKTWDLQKRTAEGAKFTAALRAADQNRLQEAAEGMAEIASNGETGYALLARFNSAGLAAQNGNGAAAVEQFMSIAADDGVDELYRDLARLMATLHEIDRGDPNALIGRLEPITEGGNPWRHSAREMTALLTRRAGDNEKATKLFRELADDPSAPAGIRARAAEMAAIVGG